MQDEHFMRQWNAGHSRFSGDLDRALLRIAGRLRHPFDTIRSIGAAYGKGKDSPLARKARLTGLAMIGGISTGTGIAALLLTLAAITQPASGHVASAACLAPPALA